MKVTKKYLIIIAAFCFTQNIFADTESKPEDPNIGSSWQLVKNGSHSSSFGSGQVVYFLSSDAYQTHKSRKFQTWDNFSVVDGRNLVRLKKKDGIEIINSRFNGSIYQVKLLNGFYKDKTYFLIAEELEKNFKKKEIVEDENI
ncbi:MAG: hypothetical protein HOF62_01100 [Gammaproteobacteria bacterium]|nr:hypothetical protein [Gammaproteobacteria bacterium]